MVREALVFFSIGEGKSGKTHVPRITREKQEKNTWQNVRTRARYALSAHAPTFSFSLQTPLPSRARA